jgi:hypothetical protein
MSDEGTDMTDVIMQRVRRGEQWMIENRPGALKGVNIDILNMLSVNDCVLGQTGGFFPTTSSEFDWEWSDEHGFSVDGFCSNDYELLRDAWVIVIREHKRFVEVKLDQV